MSNLNFLQGFRRKLTGYLEYRKFKARIFRGLSGIDEIEAKLDTCLFRMRIRFRNGLVLTLNHSGVADFENRDPGFSPAVSLYANSVLASESPFLHLNRIVLESLLDYMLHSTTPAQQRERAAEASSWLWKAVHGSPAPEVHSFLPEEKLLVFP